MYFTIFNLESERCTNNMKPLNPGSSGIDYQHVIAFRIANHLKNMRMSAYEDIRSVTIYKLSCTRIISPGISADMSHKDLHALALEEAMEGMFEAESMVVAVSSNTYQRLE